MSDPAAGFSGRARLALRYPEITAVVAPRQLAGESPASSDGLAEDAIRFFARRGLPTSAENIEGTAHVCLSSGIEPSRHPLFREVVDLWTARSGAVLQDCRTAYGPAQPDGAGGFRDAWATEERYRAALASLSSESPTQSAPEGWAQATGGDPDALPGLEDAFCGLCRDGRISRYAGRGITLARQGTCAPYGLPAVLVRLSGTCRIYAERLGMGLLETNPRVVALTEVGPATVLVESAPPLDNLWDESRFWEAWRSLAQPAWSVVEAWAAVRTLRCVETEDARWPFYDHTYLPRHAKGHPGAPPALPPARPALGAWHARRYEEASLALQLDGSPDAGLRRHVYGRLAIPFPFIHTVSGWQAACAVDEWLASVAAALHRAMLAGDAVPPNHRENLRALVDGLSAERCQIGPARDAHQPRPIHSRAVPACAL